MESIVLFILEIDYCVYLIIWKYGSTIKSVARRAYIALVYIHFYNSANLGWKGFSTDSIAINLILFLLNSFFEQPGRPPTF